LSSNATKLKPEVRCERGGRGGGEAHQQKVYSLSYFLLFSALRKPTEPAVPKERSPATGREMSAEVSFLEVLFLGLLESLVSAAD